jgi:hypothetical protein
MEVNNSAIVFALSPTDDVAPPPVRRDAIF